jgi:hypothetical protein
VRWDWGRGGEGRRENKVWIASYAINNYVKVQPGSKRANGSESM